ncbi:MULTISPECIES: hypothetical protein [unclassified Variovorax]|uniref:hypothetical protein n=1 Tax=unclassified Variovorax TaxID=663243 RepID=UPI0013193B87|nr:MULTISPECIES: hypothetical protein [unclassified Variovorax]VTU42700.1 hypothetical protein H6P1_00257 [Variovorax sp. PBL-H6]VTU43741.1 hypothetical protein SRS16P1_00646 [Variovorax sp. SRS16]VTU43807.1 hypothetical protein E5P1_00640 [Variovorax sp. PBL-E5]
MRKGNKPRLVVNSSGALVAVATGSDATTEHQGGMDALSAALTEGPGVSRLALAQRLRKDGRLHCPDLMATKRIVRDLANVVYEERLVQGEPAAALVYIAGKRAAAFGNSFIDAELRLNVVGDSTGLGGAWDERSFGIKVKGQERVKQLRAFAQAVKAGRAIFAGTFLEGEGLLGLSGVIIAIEDLLEPRHREAMAKAQAAFESDVRLHANGRADELLAKARTLQHRSILHIWPIWKDGVVDGEVIYAMNPGFNVDADYWGPYSFDQLNQWLEAGAVAPLRANKVQLAAA